MFSSATIVLPLLAAPLALAQTYASTTTFAFAGAALPTGLVASEWPIGEAPYQHEYKRENVVVSDGFLNLIVNAVDAMGGAGTLTVAAYVQLLSGGVVTRALLISVVITAIGTAFSLGITVLAAYGLSRPGSLFHCPLLFVVLLTFLFGGDGGENVGILALQKIHSEAASNIKRARKRQTLIFGEFPRTSTGAGGRTRKYE